MIVSQLLRDIVQISHIWIQVGGLQQRRRPLFFVPRMKAGDPELELQSGALRISLYSRSQERNRLRKILLGKQQASKIRCCVTVVRSHLQQLLPGLDGG